MARVSPTATQIDPNKCLPPELAVQSVDDILYRIGLCLTSVRDEPKRLLIDHPLIAFGFVFIFMTERLITISLSEENVFLFKILGDIGYFVGFSLHFGVMFILCSLFNIISQMIFYYNHKNDVKPTFLILFQVMSGLTPPAKIGLKNDQEIRSLVKTTGKLYKFLKFNNDRFIPIATIAFNLGFYGFHGSLYDVLVYGIPNTILFDFWTHYVWNMICFQFMSFYIICLYLKFKINSLNESLLEMQRSNRFSRIRETLKAFDLIHKEINEYNETFWSKILFAFWLIFALFCILVLYITLFIEMALPIKILFAYVLLIVTTIFTFLIFTASSVNKCANKSHKIMNSLIITFSNQNKYRFSQKISSKIKVRI